VTDGEGAGEDIGVLFKEKGGEKPPDAGCAKDGAKPPTALPAKDGATGCVTGG
jgi:hypothetical protein